VGVTIRRARPADAADLAEFAERAFTDTYAASTRPADLRVFITDHFGERHQAREIADADVRTLLLEMDGRLAGYAQLRSREPPRSVETPDAIELMRFYIDRPWHGRGLAQRLMRSVYECARELGGRAVWLSVWEHNPRAIAFYGKCGFEVVGRENFQVGSDRQIDHIMARALPPEDAA
jgi:ribosomal protein S18 acetylase RimI-like enzyme